jgi:hypothetical protein
MPGSGRSRHACQFIYPLSVKVLDYGRRKNQVTVEMKTKGRFQGTTWFLDANALGRSTGEWVSSRSALSCRISALSCRITELSLCIVPAAT